MQAVSTNKVISPLGLNVEGDGDARIADKGPGTVWVASSRTACYVLRVLSGNIGYGSDLRACRCEVLARETGEGRAARARKAYRAAC